MIILTNCLTDVVDEGSVKVASTLIRQIKSRFANVELISYERSNALCDHHIQVNKLLLNGKLFSLLNRLDGPILYMPFPSKMISTAIRAFILSLFSRKRLFVLLPMRSSEIGFLSRLLMKLSKAAIIVLSHELLEDYTQLFGPCVKYIKAGVDTDKFMPAEQSRKEALRRKYGIPNDKPVLLHIGHMKHGRNISTLLNVDEKFHIVLVVSTLTSHEHDADLRARIDARSNITLIDTYIPDIQEIYQLADVYFFPVTDENHCISVPLSVLEAAACDLPVVCTKFSELKQFIGAEGFYFIDSFEPEQIHSAVNAAIQNGKGGRKSVMAYDWKCSADRLLALLQETSP